VAENEIRRNREANKQAAICVPWVILSTPHPHESHTHTHTHTHIVCACLAISGAFHSHRFWSLCNFSISVLIDVEDERIKTVRSQITTEKKC